MCRVKSFSSSGIFCLWTEQLQETGNFLSLLEAGEDGNCIGRCWSGRLAALVMEERCLSVWGSWSALSMPEHHALPLLLPLLQALLCPSSAPDHVPSGVLIPP